MDRRLLRDRLRRAPARRRQPRRPFRAQAVLPHRAHGLRRRIVRCRLLGLCRPPDRLPGRDGRRGGPHDPVVAVHHQRRLPRPHERARAIGAWGGTIGLGIAIGPIAGGLLLSRFWWGSIFIVNIPIVLIAARGAAAWCRIEEPGRATARPVGAVLSIAGLGLLLWAIIEGPTQGWTSGIVSATDRPAWSSWPASSPGSLAARTRCSSSTFFGDRRFSVAPAAECLGVFGLDGALFLSTQFLQFDLG